MASIIDTLIPQYAVDYVAIFDADFQQLFSHARPVKVRVTEDAKVMTHPVENGSIITDHRVVLPITIEISLILQAADYKDTYKAIRQYYLSGKLLIVQTRAGTYKNQIIESMPHEEDPAQYDAITIALTLKQVQFVTAKYGVLPKNPTNSSTVDRGVQQPQPVDHPSVIIQKFGGHL